MFESLLTYRFSCHSVTPSNNTQSQTTLNDTQRRATKTRILLHSSPEKKNKKNGKKKYKKCTKQVGNANMKQNERKHIRQTKKMKELTTGSLKKTKKTKTKRFVEKQTPYNQPKKLLNKCPSSSHYQPGKKTKKILFPSPPLLFQIGSGGAGLLWRIFRAKPKSESKQKLNAEVCVWLLDKKALAEERTKKGTRCERGGGDTCQNKSGPKIWGLEWG